MKRNVLVAGILGLALTSCDNTTSVSPVLKPEGLWALSTLIHGDQAIRVPEPDRYTVNFSAEGALNARADCNVCNSSYQVSGALLSIGLMACTRAYCAPPSLHDEYVAALQSGSTFEQREQELRIGYSSGTLIFARKD